MELYAEVKGKNRHVLLR